MKVRDKGPKYTRRPAFPAIKDKYNEDPAAFLAADDINHPLARIRGIQNPGLLNAWEAAERRAFGARPRILNAIDDRRQELDGSDAT